MLPSERRFRRTLAVIALGAAALACKAPSSSFDPHDMTPWEAILAETPEDGVWTLEQSRQAFSLLIAPLPDVEIPEGVNPERALATGHDNGALGGTPVVNSILEYWDELDPEEQEIVQATILLPIEETARGEMRADSPTLAQFRQLAQEAELAVGTASGLGPLGVPVHVAMMDRSGVDGTGITYAFVQGVNAMGKAGGPGPMESCFLGVYSETVALNQLHKQLVMTHELFHCYQHKITGSAGATAPKWIDESTAEWVAHEIVGDDTLIYSVDQWNDTPERTISTRTYDGVGLLHEVHYLGTSMWPLLPNLVRSRTTEEAISYLASTRLQNSWAASLHRKDWLGYEWTMKGRGVPSAIGNASATIMDIGSPGGTEVILVKPWAAQILIAPTAAEIVDVNVLGHVRVGDTNRPNYADVLNPRWLCTANDCNCPDGSPLPMVVARVKPPLVFGVTGWSDGAWGTIHGSRLEDYCFQDPPPPATLEPLPPPPCQVPEGNFCTRAAALEETTSYVVRNSRGHPDWFEDAWLCHVEVVRAAEEVVPSAIADAWARILTLYDLHTTPTYRGIGWDLDNVVLLGDQTPEEFITNREEWEEYEEVLDEYGPDLEAASNHMRDFCNVEWIEF